MPNVLNLALLLGAGAVLTAPLLYGLSTLRGMKHRSYIPLLRFKRRDGTILTMAAERGSA